MYSTRNEGKSVVVERFIRTLKIKIYKHMTAVSKNMYIDQVDDIVNECNNAYHRTIKMKPIDVKGNTYINSIKEVNDKDPKFQVGAYVRISRYKNIFANGYTPNWSEEIFVISNIINDLNSEEIVGTFYEKELQKINQKKLRTKKAIKRERNKQYVKWKGYDNSFNRWIDKKDLIE